MRFSFLPKSVRPLDTSGSLILVLCLVAVNVGLQLRVRALAARVSYLEQTRGPTVGEPIPELTGTDLEGHPMAISFASSARSSLLLVYSPQCSYCERNLTQWQHLLSDRLNTNIFLIDVSGQMTREELNKMKLPTLSGLIRVSNASRLENNFVLTPTTVVVSPRGLVKYAALGMLDTKTLDALRGSLRETQPSPPGGSNE